MTSTTSVPIEARAELRAWYLRRLRPKLVEAARAGIVESAAVDELDLQVTDLFDLRLDCRAARTGS